MKVGIVQHDIVWEQPERTREQVRPMIAQAAGADARLVVLSEMYATGFSMRPERIAEDEGGPNEQFLSEQAAQHGITVIASIAQRGSDGNYRNNAVVARADGRVERYAKIHPFSYAGEHERYAAGEHFLTVDIDGLRVSTFVCYDLRFADEFWALAQRTDAFVVPANWPQPRHEHWRALLRARAIENQCYVVGVNRVGLAKDLPHAGGSTIVDPLGVNLVEAGDAPAVLCAEVDPAVVRQVRADFPFLQDRR
ncbi:nitrilase-related carbon-nitrogen hydrolase [uncultured Jatrophihabitans sp.]|uniref:nitrilase-related carbon-nitrogen hydrolase n=1 Tax=uncultured Jatrophihabitans sp. TaxID=1610747 RepID=UPI0035CC627E